MATLTPPGFRPATLGAPGAVPIPGQAAALPPARPTLVWLGSYPKSGNTWLRLFLAN
ncbi:MAG: hypothetical protein WD100_03000 [Tistlia sp.]